METVLHVYTNLNATKQMSALYLGLILQQHTLQKMSHLFFFFFLPLLNTAQNLGVLRQS